MIFASKGQFLVASYISKHHNLPYSQKLWHLYDRYGRPQYRCDVTLCIVTVCGDAMMMMLIIMTKTKIMT